MFGVRISVAASLCRHCGSRGQDILLSILWEAELRLFLLKNIFYWSVFQSICDVSHFLMTFRKQEEARGLIVLYCSQVLFIPTHPITLKWKPKVQAKHGKRVGFTGIEITVLVINTTKIKYQWKGAKKSVKHFITRIWKLILVALWCVYFIALCLPMTQLSCRCSFYCLHVTP